MMMQDGKPKAPQKALFTTRELTIIGMLSGITILLGITGYGLIPLPWMKMTVMHIPVIIGALVAGPKPGAMIGLIFGIFSMVQAYMAPVIMSIALMNPLISILPRILIGLGAYYAYKVLIKSTGKESVSLGIAGFIGSAINTIGVMGGIYFLYAKEFALARNISLDAVIDAILSVCLINGLPEAIVSAIITIPVVIALKRVVSKQ